MSSSYLLKKSDTYYARFRVPGRHRKLLQRTEFKWSLCSNRRHEATARCAFYRHLVVRIFHMLDGLAPFTLTEREERQIRVGLKRYLEDEIAAYRYKLKRSDTEQCLELKTALMQDTPRVAIFKEALAQQDFSDPTVIGSMSQFLDLCPERIRYDFDNDNLDYRFLARHGCQAELQLYKSKIDLLQGKDLGPALSPPNPIPPIAEVVREKTLGNATISTVQRDPSLLAVVKLYLEDQQQRGLQEKTVRDYEVALNRLADCLENPTLSSVTRSDIRKFRDGLTYFPQRISTQMRSKSFAELIAASHKQCLSKESINKLLGRVSGFFAWAIREEHYRKHNPAERLDFKIESRADEKRKRFSSADLEKIFSIDIFQGRSRPSKAAHYWAPLISLYSGLRIEEICQLDVDDICHMDEVAVISVNNRGEKKLKNSSSARDIPIHPQLLQLGLLEYTQLVRRSGHTKLFPSLLKHHSNGYSHNVTQWFGRQKKVLGFQSIVQSFHSLRHTVADELKQKNVPVALTAAILGHEFGGITYNRYGKRFEPAVLLTEIQKLQFDIEVVSYSEKLLSPTEKNIINAGKRTVVRKKA